MGYVEGSQILDNVILTHELIHSLKLNKIPGVLIKLDLSKAFDKISWQYLRSILHAFDFHPTWTQWILSLVSSTFFLILVNGAPSPTFKPSRGIRQGDPLSPFLFILMEEGLNRCILETIEKNTLKGLSPHGIHPPLSHTQIVDDTMLMASPTLREAHFLKAILDDFPESSGTSINNKKYQIFFFNTPPHV